MWLRGESLSISPPVQRETFFFPLNKSIYRLITLLLIKDQLLRFGSRRYLLDGVSHQAFNKGNSMKTKEKQRLMVREGYKSSSGAWRAASQKIFIHWAQSIFQWWNENNSGNLICSLHGHFLGESMEDVGLPVSILHGPHSSRHRLPICDLSW